MSAQKFFFDQNLRSTTGSIFYDLTLPILMNLFTDQQTICGGVLITWVYPVQLYARVLHRALSGHCRDIDCMCNNLHVCNGCMYHRSSPNISFIIICTHCMAVILPHQKNCRQPTRYIYRPYLSVLLCDTFQLVINTGGTQKNFGYGCAAGNFDYQPIVKPQRHQICNPH